MSARPCGCDPEANWPCQGHSSVWDWAAHDLKGKIEAPLIYEPIPEQQMPSAVPSPPQRSEEGPRGASTDVSAMRTFNTGATRDGDSGKPDFDGFLSPLALEAFGAYMHRHRKQADGTLRASDNWQKGIPQDAYRKSMLRHTLDLWALLRGHFTAGVKKEYADTPYDQIIVNLCCAVMFNVMGLLHEHLKETT